MITLFVDTNILLSFYHLTSEDLEELRKLVALVDKKEIKLTLTDQVRNEFLRNRATKIVDAMKRLQEPVLKVSYPAFAKDYREYTELRTLLDDANKKRAQLVEAITADAAGAKLKADALVDELFGKATIIEVTEEIYLQALKRSRLGNPPGKEGSLGDAVNWECLLSKIADRTSVHFVSEDRDYRSHLSPPEMSEFLAFEWEDRKQASIHFYTRISDFFKLNFPAIKIASDIERDLHIAELCESRTFATTHLVIAKLAKHTDFSPTQIEELMRIAQTNNQVEWILGDADLHGFYSSLLKHAPKLSPDILDQLEQVVKSGEPNQ
ncbi:PIN domain-containing protein [Bradyrhizobium sp. CCGB12]|uniref:PIN domain-containing protein n=1 Tax=Bradyrhizobium sp. CCGB12 TaxID=2949632 RepID=UPI0020B1E227|nr:PIN domain-containing protein [Bradyrhizobium sp. CCGB12]MCP3391875.1 PIN domain-containing protein [Bradyrhizobium sp. CCGB12]